jgi:hypothetical protein
MGKAIVRAWCMRTLVVGIICLSASLAHAGTRSAATLEQEAQSEFSKAGTAVRERLDREAAGDEIGARVAARDAEAHRYRFLDIERELNHLHARPSTSPSVAARRNPFLPDASFLAPPASSTIPTATAVARSQGEVSRAAYPTWDMYRPRESGGLAETDGRDSPQELRAIPAAAALRRAGDMYATDVANSAPGDRGSASMQPSATASPGESARQPFPFLVYRERPAASDASE